MAAPASLQADTFDDLDHLAGTWTQEEADEFDDALKGQRQIEGKQWQPIP